MTGPMAAGRHDLAQRLLVTAYGASVERLHLSGRAGGSPDSVVLKWLREDPDGSRADPAQVSTERAALEFLEERGIRVAPRLIGADLDAGLLILEDITPSVTLADVLAADGPAGTIASEGLLSFAKALGALRAQTAADGDRYYLRRRRYGPVDAHADRRSGFSRHWRSTADGVADLLGLGLDARVAADVHVVLETLAEPGPFLVFSNGDSGANNFLLDGAAGRIIDFEFAGYRHALADAAAFYTPGTEWITIPDPGATGVEATYRGALAEGVPEAEDDKLYGRGVAVASLAFAVARLHRLRRLDGRPSGHRSRLQMVSTLESAAVAATAHRSLPRLAAWARDVAARLRARWPDADVDLSLLRPYRRRAD